MNKSLASVAQMKMKLSETKAPRRRIHGVFIDRWRYPSTTPSVDFKAFVTRCTSLQLWKFSIKISRFLPITLYIVKSLIHFFKLVVMKCKVRALLSLAFVNYRNLRIHYQVYTVHANVERFSEGEIPFLFVPRVSKCKYPLGTNVISW